MRLLPLVSLAVSIVASPCYGQVLTQARTDVYYDSPSNTVYQVSSASIDYSTEYYYSLDIRSYLRQNGLVVSYDFEGSGGDSYASTYAETPGDGGSFFDAISYYNLSVTYQTYEVGAGTEAVSSYRQKIMGLANGAANSEVSERARSVLGLAASHE